MFEIVKGSEHVRIITDPFYKLFHHICWEKKHLVRLLNNNKAAPQIVKIAVPQMATWGWHQNQVNDHWIQH